VTLCFLAPLSQAGVITIAGQTAKAERVWDLGKNGKSILLFHGTDDNCLPHGCALKLYAGATEPKELVLYENDGRS